MLVKEQLSRTKFWMLLHCLTNFEMKDITEMNEDLNGVFSRNDLLKNVKNRAYVLNCNEYIEIGTHWIICYFKNDDKIYLILVLNIGLKVTNHKSKKF